MKKKMVVLVLGYALFKIDKITNRRKGSPDEMIIQKIVKFQTCKIHRRRID